MYPCMGRKMVTGHFNKFRQAPERYKDQVQRIKYRNEEI